MGSCQKRGLNWVNPGAPAGFEPATPALGLNGYGLFPIVPLLLVSLPIWAVLFPTGSRRIGAIPAHIERINVNRNRD
jgi:hypothetical protein